MRTGEEEGTYTFSESQNKMLMDYVLRLAATSVPPQRKPAAPCEIPREPPRRT